jgi:hypothetical protein
MHKSESRSSGKSVDKFLLSLDVGAFGALYRVLIGFMTIPVMRLLLGSDGSDWTLVPFLLLVLVLPARSCEWIARLSCHSRSKLSNRLSPWQMNPFGYRKCRTRAELHGRR